MRPILLLALTSLGLLAQTIHYRGADVPYRLESGRVIIHGDIVAGTLEELAAKAEPRWSTGVGNSLWPKVGNIVPIPYVNQSTDANIPAAIQVFNRQFQGVAQWVTRTNETDYVVFTNDRGICNSFLGRRQGPQEVNATGCGLIGALHEMGHAVGLAHQTLQPDRDQYIRLVPEEMVPDLEISTIRVDRIISPFSYSSIVDNVYNRTGGFSFETIPLGIPTLSSRTEYSESDVDAIRRLCSGTSTQVTVSTWPAGLRVIVDGTAVTAPQTFNWPLGSTHTLEVAEGAQALNGSMHVFGNWGNLGARRQTITVTPGTGSPTEPTTAPAITLYTANFARYLAIDTSNSEGQGTVTISPAGTVFPGVGTFYLERQIYTITANPAAGFSLAGWTSDGRHYVPPPYYGSPARFSPGSNMAMRPQFVARPVTTFATNPPGLPILVNGQRTPTSVSYVEGVDAGWTPGSTQRIGPPATPQRPNGVTYAAIRYVFENWSDGGAPEHDIIAATVATTPKVITANFRAEFRITTSSNVSCSAGLATVSPATAENFYRAGTPVTLTATAPTGFTFTGWLGWPDLPNTATATANVDRERIVEPQFNTIDAPLRIESMTPTAIAAGAAVTLVINGSGFTDQSWVHFKTDLNGVGVLRQPHLISAAQVQLDLTAADLTGVTTLQINVQNRASNCNASAKPVTVVLARTAPAPAVVSRAVFVKRDTTTRGAWKGVYGTDGYLVIGETPNYPAGIAVTPSGHSPFTWAGSTTDPRVLLKPLSAFDRNASCWYSNSSFNVEINASDDRTRQVAIYMVDWDSVGRAQRVDVLDPAGNVLDTQNVTAFQDGQYLVWNLTGRVTLRFTPSGTPATNVVLGGIFFGAGGAATFLSRRDDLRGDWPGQFGSEGYEVLGDSARIPAYASVTPIGVKSFVWTSTTDDPRAAQRAFPTVNRTAATWYDETGFSVDIAMNDAQPHQLTAYMYDWDSGRRQRLELVNSDGVVLDTQIVENFQNGVYFSWTVRGRVTLRVLNNGGQNAVLQALFFGPAGPVPAPLGVPTGSWQLIDGILARATAAADGTFFGSNESTALFLRAFNGWRQAPGAAALVAATSASRIWVSIGFQCFVGDGIGAWTAVNNPAGAVFVNIAAGSDGTLMAIDTENRIHRRDAITGVWSVVPAMADAVPRRLAVRNASEFYYVTPTNAIVKNWGGAYSLIPGALHDLTISAAGELWGTTGPVVWRYTGNGWVSLPGPAAPLNQVVVGNNYTIYGIAQAPAGEGNIYRLQ